MTHKRTLRLISLTLRNFKGIPLLVLEPNGSDMSIYGKNGTGKTTVASSWYWLLFGKDSEFSTKFNIKTLDKGQPVRGLEHSVEGVLEVDGKRVTFMKVFKEVWETTRGQALSEFKGHTTAHYRNEEPISERDYQIRVGQICDEKTFWLLSHTSYFSVHLKWDERRRMLLDICGDITDAEVIASNKKLAELPEILGEHTIDAYRKIADAKRKNLNEEIGKLPIRIDEVQRGMPPADEFADEADLQATIETERKALTALQERRATAAAGGEVAQKVTRVKEIEGELLSIVTRLRTANAGDREAALARIREKDREISEAEHNARSLRSRAAQSEADATRLEPLLQELRDRRDAEGAKGFAGVESCPACGQALPADQVEAAREEFNAHKAQRLETIQSEGRTLRARQNELSAEAGRLKGEADQVDVRIGALRSEKEAIAVPEETMLDSESDAEYSAKVQEKAALEVRIQELRSGASTALVEVDQEIAAVTVRLQTAQAAKAAAEQRKQGEARITELSERERALAKALEKIDSEIFLMENFIRAKVAMLTDKINGRFKLAKFKLFDQQINGGITECCEATIDGRPYGGALSNGERVKVGLDIINTLAEHHGFAPPIFIDNSESVTDMPATVGQQIRLVASQPDKALRIETSQRAEPAQKELISA